MILTSCCLVNIKSAGAKNSASACQACPPSGRRVWVRVLSSCLFWQVLYFIGGKNVAIHKSAIKRDRQSKVQRLRNAGYKTMAKNAVKELRLAIANKKIEDANLSLNKAVSTLQKVQSKGVLHKNTASRKISRLTRQINKLATMSAEGNKEEKSDSPK